MRPVELADARVILEHHLHLGRCEDQEILLNLGDGGIESEDVAGQGIGVLALGEAAEEVIKIPPYHRVVDADTRDNQGIGLEGNLALGPGAYLLALYLAEKIISTRIDGFPDSVIRPQGTS